MTINEKKEVVRVIAEVVKAEQGLKDGTVDADECGQILVDAAEKLSEYPIDEVSEMVVESNIFLLKEGIV